jgi:hypothetical protein
MYRLQVVFAWGLFSVRRLKTAFPEPAGERIVQTAK